MRLIEAAVLTTLNGARASPHPASTNAAAGRVSIAGTCGPPNIATSTPTANAQATSGAAATPPVQLALPPASVAERVVNSVERVVNSPGSPLRDAFSRAIQVIARRNDLGV